MGMISSVLYPSKNVMAKGRTTRKQNRDPMINSTVAEKIKGRKYFFSLGIKPGEINFQKW